MKEVKAYKCDFCNKVSLGKLFHHEKYCKHNPENKHACFNCEFLTVDLDITENCFGQKTSIKTFHCDKKHVLMHSYIAERRKLNVVNGTERMPVKCDLWKFNENDFE